jgi:hypothetical protein
MNENSVVYVQEQERGMLPPLNQYSGNPVSEKHQVVKYNNKYV